MKRIEEPNRVRSKDYNLWEFSQDVRSKLEHILIKITEVNDKLKVIEQRIKKE